MAGNRFGYIDNRGIYIKKIMIKLLFLVMIEYLAILFLSPIISFSETIYLDDGSVITCILKSMDEDKVIIETEEGTKTIERRRLLRIEKERLLKSASFNIDINLVNAFMGIYNGRFQIGISPRLSLDLSGSFFKNRSTIISSAINNYDGVSGSIGVSWYYKRNLFNGPFFLFYFSTIYAWWSNLDSDGKSKDEFIFAPIFIAGWQWRWNFGLNISLGGGWVWYFPTREEIEIAETIYIGEDAEKGAASIKLLLSIGYAF